MLKLKGLVIKKESSNNRKCLSNLAIPVFTFYIGSPCNWCVLWILYGHSNPFIFYRQSFSLFVLTGIFLKLNRYSIYILYGQSF